MFLSTYFMIAISKLIISIQMAIWYLERKVIIKLTENSERVKSCENIGFHSRRPSNKDEYVGEVM